MARIKSLIEQVQIDRAGKAHNCQANVRHRVEKGDLRLKVRNGRSWDHYCLACAEVIIDRDIEKLANLRRFEVSIVMLPPGEPYLRCQHERRPSFSRDDTQRTRRRMAKTSSPIWRGVSVVLCEVKESTILIRYR